MIDFEPRPRRVLCLSGGGFRGFYTASLLRYVQKDLKVQSFNENFDLIIGTSTGAIIAAGLSLGVPARSIQKAFAKNGSKIFKTPAVSGTLGNAWKGGRRLFWSAAMRPQYSTDVLREVIEDILGKYANQPLTSLNVPLAIVAVNQPKRAVEVFGAGPFAASGDPQVKLVDAILASAAAPYYFDPYVVVNKGIGSVPTHKFVDGGVASNSPVLLGLSIVKKRYRAPLEQIYILHVDTAGTTSRHALTKYGLATWWPFRGFAWGLDLLDLAMTAQEDLQISMAEELLGQHYVRMSVPPAHAKHAQFELDDASKLAIGALYALAGETWNYWHKRRELAYFFPPSLPALPTDA